MIYEGLPSVLPCRLLLTSHPSWHRFLLDTHLVLDDGEMAWERQERAVFSNTDKQRAAVFLAWLECRSLEQVHSHATA